MCFSGSKILSQHSSPQCGIPEIPDQFTLILSPFWIIPRASPKECSGHVTDGFLQKAFPKATRTRLHHVMQDYIIPQHPAFQVFPELTELCSVEPAPQGVSASGMHISYTLSKHHKLRALSMGQRLTSPGPEQNSQALTTFFFLPSA